MSKFWQKKYTSKYTGAEIDAAVAKADTVPAVTAADAGKALVVDEEGKIVPGEAGGASTIVFLTADVNGDLGVSYNDIMTGIGAGAVYFYKFTEKDPGPPTWNNLNICPLGSMEALTGTVPGSDLYKASFSYSSDPIMFYSTTADGILNINEPTP